MHPDAAVAAGSRGGVDVPGARLDSAHGLSSAPAAFLLGGDGDRTAFLACGARESRGPAGEDGALGAGAAAAGAAESGHAPVLGPALGGGAGAPQQASRSRRLPGPEAPGRLTYRIMVFEFPVWTFGIIAGAIWADQA